MQFLKFVIPQHLYDELRLHVNTTNHQTLVLSDSQGCEPSTPEIQVCTPSNSNEASPSLSKLEIDDKSNQSSLEEEKDSQGLCVNPPNVGNPSEISLNPGCTSSVCSEIDSSQFQSFEHVQRGANKLSCEKQNDAMCGNALNPEEGTANIPHPIHGHNKTVVKTFPHFSCAICSLTFNCHKLFTAHCKGHKLPAQKHKLPVQKRKLPVQKHKLPVQKHKLPVQKRILPVQKRILQLIAYPRTCPVCKKNYASRSSFSNHKKWCNKVKASSTPIRKTVCRHWPCTYCDWSYVTETSLKRHLKDGCFRAIRQCIRNRRKEAEKNNVIPDNVGTDSSSSEDDNSVKWIPLTEEATSSAALKYFVVNKSSSQ